MFARSYIRRILSLGEGGTLTGDAMRNWAVVISYSAESVDLRPTNTDFAAEDIPWVTLGFRHTLGHVFSSMRELKGAPAKVVFAGRRSTLMGGCLFQSDRAKLDRTQPHDFIAVLVLQDSDDMRRRFEKRIQMGHSEQDIVLALESAALRVLAPEVYGTKLQGYAGINVFPVAERMESLRLICCLHAFYYYGWLICTRLERWQSALEISDYDDFWQVYFRHMIEIRTGLINIKRYFLTKNRSNLPAVKEQCVMLLDRLGIEARYTRLTDIHESMESQADNIAKYDQLVRSDVVKKATELVTFFVVPIGLFAAAMSVQADSPWLADDLGILSNARFWQIVALSLLAPVAVVMIGAVVERMRSAYRSIRGMKKARAFSRTKFSRRK